MIAPSQHYTPARVLPRLGVTGETVGELQSVNGLPANSFLIPRASPPKRLAVSQIASLGTRLQATIPGYLSVRPSLNLHVANSPDRRSGHPPQARHQ